MSLFAFVIIHQGHERKEINLCLSSECYHDLTHRRFRGAVDFAIKQGGKYF